MSKGAKNFQVVTLEQWRMNPQLVGWAYKLFNTPEWNLLCRVMQEGEHVRLHDTATPITSDRQLGRIEGWDLYHNFQKKAGEPMQVQGEMPESTFEPEEVQKQEQEKE